AEASLPADRPHPHPEAGGHLGASVPGCRTQAHRGEARATRDVGAMVADAFFGTGNTSHSDAGATSDRAVRRAHPVAGGVEDEVDALEAHHSRLPAAERAPEARGGPDGPIDAGATGHAAASAESKRRSQASRSRCRCSTTSNAFVKSTSPCSPKCSRTPRAMS